ncbi:MAG: hypothetical protein JRJ75_09625 [Deltaproteobacteria bacterium]|nr:hypothetical protein [Deltaproteobacteria bacterium]MBW1930000.1 hypothetical protein [Deltaproteobacteria bacterium]MBW2026690.1 hypothetical protein [Deltaproteobacteria bacterium]
MAFLQGSVVTEIAWRKSYLDYTGITKNIGLHNDQFDFTDAALPVGAAMMVGLVLRIHRG